MSGSPDLTGQTRDNSQDPRETELKLEFDPADLGRIRAHPLLAATDSKQKTLHSIYYDTADLVLHKAGVSLRVRDTGGRFVQTIKSANGNAGLFDRSEWEHEVKGRNIDLIAARGTALEPLLSVRVRNALRPVFETRVERTVYQLERNGSDIEVALDRGEVDAGGRQAAIHELELELKHGEPAELFRLARQLDAFVPLRIAGKVKAERGYELVEDAQQTFEKAGPLELDPSMATGDAFRAIVQNCLRQIIANEPGVRAGDAEALHQMRIGLRRLRAAIAGFAKVSADSEQDRIKAELKWATNELGPARDLDVFATDVLKHLSETGAGEKEFAEASCDFTLKRGAVYAVATDFVRSDRFRRSLLDVAEWVETGPWTIDAGADAERPVEKQAAEVLAKFRKRIREKGKHLRELDARARHKLRIRAKNLRYMIEFLVGVFPGHKNAKKRKAALTSLRTLQDTLGSLNDIVARKALISNGDGLSVHAAAMVDAGEAKADKLLEQARVAHAHFNEVKAFWKS
jgi:inorganic triphosphatase YgiF